MRQTKLKHILLSAFIGSILCLIFLQFNANRSIKNLIESNKQLEEELLLKNRLQELRSDLLSLEATLKTVAISMDTQRLMSVEQEVEQLSHKINLISKHNKSIDDETSHLFDELQQLILKKVRFSKDLLDTLNARGKMPTVEMLANSENENLTSRILATVQHLDSSSEKDAFKFSNHLDKESLRAFNWGLVTVIMACLFGLGAFIFITGRIRKQEQLYMALDASQKKEKELAGIKDQFLANMSHEIRTPMNAVLGFASLLRKQQLDPKSRDYVESIMSSGETLLGIINDILDTSKIEAGMLRIEKAPFSLRELIHSVEVMFISKLEHSPVRLQTFIAENVPDNLKGDSMRLTQILVNLINNAVKFTEKGTIDISITLTERNASGVRLQYKVKDTGIGIDQSKLHAVFDRFVQADADTTRQYGGTGLGLAIVKQLVELQNGSVGAESETGKGSCFTVELPYELAAAAAETPKLSPVTKDVLQQADIRVLIAEDNRMNQKLIKHLMEAWGMQYRIVTNGKEAIEALNAETFDVLLMDIQMPLMNGYTAAQLIRTELESRIPIIAMTAHAMPGEKEKCINYGMNDYIPKPIREDELLKLIRHYCGTEQQVIAEKNELPIGEKSEFRMIQLDYLRELSRGNSEFEKEITEEFLVQVPQQITELKTSIQENNYEAIRAQAHNLKTSVSFLGLHPRLFPCIDAIESEAENKGSLQLIQENYHRLDADIKVAVTEANQFLSQLT